ncbi:MAG: phosphomannomutase/phosphoglucomutase [Pseudomonadota bacterium]
MATEKEQEMDLEEKVVLESTESQIIETGFIAQKPSEEPDKDSKKVSRRSKKTAIDNQLIKIIVALVVAALFAFLAYQDLDSIAEQYLIEQQQQVQVEVEKVADTISRQIKKFQNKFNKQQFPKMSDGETINSEEFFPGSKISFFSLPLDHLAIVDNPAQGNAFLVLLNQLYSAPKGQISTLELIKPKSDFSAIVIAKKAVLDINAETEKVIGFYVCMVPGKFASQLLDNIDLGENSIKLYQGALVKLALKGARINNAVTKTHTIKNSHWRVSYSSALKTLDMNPSSYLLFMLFALMAFILVVYSLFLIINKIKTLKQFTKEESAEDSILAYKQAISKLGMKSTSALTDITKTPASENLNSEQAISTDKIDPLIFSDYGIRGIYGTQINAAIFTYLAHGIAQQMENNDLSQLTIGYDGRTSSEELYLALLEGFKPYELQIIDLGLVTLPVVYFCAQTQTQGNALMVTAGSSPAEYNGLKILLNNQIYSQSQLNQLRDTTPEEGRPLCKIEKQNLNHNYINSFSENFNLAKQLNVVVDFANSVTSQIIFDLLKMLGCQVIPLFEELDGKCPNHPPGPSKAENLQALSEKVKSEAADLGLAFNGDGSALGVISSNGDIIWADRVLMLLARDLLQQQPGAKVMYDVKSSSSLHEWIIQYKGEPELTPSGHSNIKQRMEANHTALAGEYSGHLFYAEHAHGLDDAFYVAAKLLQIISNFPGKSADLFIEIPDKISTPEVLIPVQPGQQAEIMEKILSQKNEFKPAGIISLDGLRVEYEDGWGVVRKSNTTSSLSLRFEADNPKALQRIAEKFKEVILSVVFVKFPY